MMADNVAENHHHFSYCMCIFSIVGNCFFLFIQRIDYKFLPSFLGVNVVEVFTAGGVMS